MTAEPDARTDSTAGAASSTASYLDAVASSRPTPGGGSVAGVVGALAAALGEMVCRLSPSTGDAQTDLSMSDALSRFSAARAALLQLAEGDETAYGAFRGASSLPKTSPEEKLARSAAMQNALVGAALVPLATARASRDLLPDILHVATHGNRHVRSDAVIASILAFAAVRACAVNVHINTAMLRDKDHATELDNEIGAIVADASRLAAQTN